MKEQEVKQNIPNQWEVGFKRDFRFKPGKYYIVKEVLTDPDIQMEWVWTRKVLGLITTRNKKLHDFHKIEILVDREVKDEEVTMKDIIIIGLSQDNRVLLLTTKKYKEAFSKSTLFKKFENEIK